MRMRRRGRADARSDVAERRLSDSFTSGREAGRPSAGKRIEGTADRRRRPLTPGFLVSAELASGVTLLAGLAVTGLFVAWSGADGGYGPEAWYPGAFFLLVLLAFVAARGRPRLVRPSSIWAVALLAGFTAWSFTSIAWAAVKGDAWDGANRTLLYLTVYALAALTSWRRRD